MSRDSGLDDTHEWIVEAENEGTRLDKYVTDRLVDISRSAVQLWIRDGSVTVSTKPVKANYKVKAGDEIRCHIPAPAESEIVPEAIPLDVVYEDHDIIVVNKPRGMVVHPAPGHDSGTLVNALLHHCEDLSGINGERRPGIVHRIDKDTSGLLVAAKHDQAHRHLAEQLKQHEVERKYRAVVHGVPAHDHGTIDAPIGRDERDRKKFKVTEKNSKSAVTHFSVLERFQEAAYLELALETGRTHQIRVHMTFIGHPLIGDPLYGRSRKSMLDGQALHAASLGFVHPVNGKDMHFTAPLPDDLERLLDWYRKRI